MSRRKARGTKASGRSRSASARPAGGRTAALAERSGWAQWAAGGYGRGLLTLLAVYLVLYGGLLIWTDGLPYVSDNNESFSVFWHAQNMANQSFFRSYWLTDEAFSPLPEAHPFVHTHQGNVPRIFGLLLYLLGARTIEAQIVITTLTLGVLCVFLMYHVFTRMAGPRFALVTSLVFLTDYIFYAQWHIVTYRVWHGIFLFGGLACADRLFRATHPRRWLLVTWLTFAGLFYYELVFVAFASILCALYAVMFGWRQPRRVVLFGVMQALGGVTALGVLTLQLTAYLGWDGLKQDIYLTFVSRNFADPSIQAQVEAFYAANNVAFWKNVMDSTPYRTPQALLDVLLTFHLQVWTPLLQAMVLMVLTGWLLGLAGRPAGLMAWLRPRIGARVDWWRARWPGALPTLDPGSWSARGHLNVRVGPMMGRAYLSLGMEPAALLRTLLWWGLRVVPLTLAGHFTLVRITADRSFLGLPAEAPPAVSPSVSALLLGVALALTVGGLLLLRRSDGEVRHAGPELGRVALATALLLSVGLLLPLLPLGYHLNNIRPIWHGAIQSLWPVNLLRGAFICALVAATALTLGGSRRLLGSRPEQSLADVARFLGCGALALVIVYALATGYVMSGYVWRAAPLWVFVLDIVLGACATVALGLALRATASLRSALAQLPASVVASPGVSPGPRVRWSQLGRVVRREPSRALSVVGVACAAGVAILLSAFTIIYWLTVQQTYLGMLPPTHFRVLKLLREPPFSGASFVSDMFAGPVAAQTGQWAYFDQVIGAGKFQEAAAGFTIERDMESYLWLADRHENPAYQRPEYFICFSAQDLRSVIARLVNLEAVYNTRCSDRGIIRQVDTGEFAPLQHQVVARDEVSDSWAIVKLSWSGYAPYLAPFEDGRRVLVTVDGPGAGRGATIAYRFAQQEGAPEQGSTVRLYRVQSGDRITLLGSLDGPGRIQLPDRFSGRIRASVTPQTATRAGYEYLSDEITVTASGR